MIVPAPLASRIAVTKSCIANPCTTLLAERRTRPSAPGAAAPLSSITGVPLKPACDQPSSITGLVTIGSGERTSISCGATPGSWNSMRFSPGASFASSSACRSEPGPESTVVVTGKRYGMTRIMNAQAFVLPESSRASQVTLVKPTGKAVPEGGTQPTATELSQISLAAGEPNSTIALPPSWGNSAAIMFVGQVICGGVVSCTRTVNAQALVLPLASVATQRTVVSPSGNSAPDGGTQTGATLLSQVSAAVVTNVTAVPFGPAHSTVMFVEQTITGGFVSTKVTVATTL